MKMSVRSVSWRNFNVINKKTSTHLFNHPGTARRHFRIQFTNNTGIFVINVLLWIGTQNKPFISTCTNNVYCFGWNLEMRFSFIASTVPPVEFALLFLIQFHYLHLQCYLHLYWRPVIWCRLWIFLFKGKAKTLYWVEAGSMNASSILQRTLAASHCTLIPGGFRRRNMIDFGTLLLRFNISCIKTSPTQFKLTA